MSSPICIVQISDFHLLHDPKQTMMGIDTDQSLAVVVDAIKEYPAHLFLLTGDLVQEPTVPTYRRLQKHLQKLNKPCYCLPGNHDDSDLMRKHLLNEAIFYQDRILLEGWQIICLDSTLFPTPYGSLSDSQLECLQKHLTDRADLLTLICFHHSPIPSGSPWLDSMLLNNADAFFDLIDRYPQVKGVVFGHVHQTMDFYRNDVRYLACPSTCFQFKPDSKEFGLEAVPQGFRWIKLHTDGSIETDIQRMDEVPEGLDMISSGYE